MAADQRRRHLNSSTFVGCSSREQREQYRSKKKKLGQPQDDLNMKYNISLEWDEKNKSVVAKREQVGILQRDLVPFIDAVSNCYSGLAGILTVPWETFELKNLAGVLSYEVWHSHFSDTERNILTQYLPRGADPDKVVQELLSGDNFHFGNPFLKWGASLCSGKLHPDDVLHQEQYIKDNKNIYFSQLQKYHNDMIENLRTWKDRLDSCKDPEEEILQQILKSRKQVGKIMHSPETVYHDPEEDDIATPESCSWATSERACSNDNNPNFPVDSQGRKGFPDSNVNNSSDGLKVVAKARKGEKLQKRNIQLGDGAKYMSYIKVSKEQHQRVKRTMKHTSNSIQSRSLNNVLGNIDTLHVQPFEVFEEEERQKLHDYWLQLANKDIPAGFANWIKKKLLAHQMVKSLCQELEEKLTFQGEDDENNNSHNLPPSELTDNVEPTVSPDASAQENEKGEVSHTLLEAKLAEQLRNEEIAIALENEEDKKTDGLHQGQTCHGTDSMEEDDESVSLSVEEDADEKIASISCRHHVTDMTVDSHDNGIITKAVDPTPVVSAYPGNMNHVDRSVSQEDHRDSADDVWSAVSVPGSFYHPSALGHQYASSSEFSLAHPQVMEEQPAQMIDLEAESEGQDTGRELLHRQSDDLSFYSSFTNQEQSGLQEKNDGKQMLHRQADNNSFFSTYPMQDRNELFESFFKGPGGGLPFHQEQKRMGLDYHQSDNLMMENGQFSADFRDQVGLSLPLEMRHGDNNIQDCVYSDGGRYSIPKHLPANEEDWGVGSVRLLAPSESHMTSGDLLGQSWFPGENRARGGWSGMEGAVASSRRIGSQSNLDQSLFSVLSECEDFRSVAAAPYETVGPVERFLQSGMYSGGLGGGIPISSGSNILQQTADPLDYLSRLESSGSSATTGPKNNNLGWMGLPHQNSGFIRSWNQ